MTNIVNSVRHPFIVSGFATLLVLAVLVSPFSATLPGASAQSGNAAGNVTRVSRMARGKRPLLDFKPGVILVRFKPDANIKGTSVREAESITFSTTARDGHQIPVQAERFDGSNLVEGLRLGHVAAEDTMAAVQALRKRDDVLYAEPDYIRRKAGAQVPPNDPEFPNMWAMNNTGQGINDTHRSSDGLCTSPPCDLGQGTPGADIKAEKAWQTYTTGSKNVVVGIIDEGMDINHEDLKSNIWVNPSPGSVSGITGDINGYNFIDNNGTVFGGNPTGSGSNYPDNTVDAHGTHVAGTVGAAGNNGKGVTGVNWQVSLMSLKVLGPSGGDDANFIRAYNYAKAMRDLWQSSGGAKGANIRVLNNSYGGGGFSQSDFDSINALNSSGILFVAAAGNETNNDDFDQSYPANYNLSNVISVAATDFNDQLTSFSNYGRTVDLGAPGEFVVSTTPNNTYDFYSGTSMSTPHVTGAAALVCAQYPNITVPQLRAALVYSGDPIASLNGKVYSGRRLNVFNALHNAGITDATPPAAATNLIVAGDRVKTLTWIAPGDNGNSGQASLYDITFVDATTGETIPLETQIPKPAGSVETATLALPFRHTAGQIVITTIDKAGNKSTASIGVSVSLAGASPYVTSESNAAALSTGGQALDLKADDAYRSGYVLPFNFPFFGTNYNSVTLSSNGPIYFTPPPRRDNGDADDVPSSIADLGGYAMIAGLWDDLRTDINPTDDVYVVKPNANTIIFRWQAVTYDTDLGNGTSRGQNPVSFEVELDSNGTIVVRYGNGNMKVFPVVGISGGEPDGYAEISHIAEFETSFDPINLPNASVVTYTPRALVPSNPIDDPTFYVSQHYHDFLNRDPDSSGLSFWVNNISSCGSDQQCVAVKRIDTSAAYFLSIEFQQTGYLVHRFYKASYGRRPLVREFFPDTRNIGQGVVVGQNGWQAQLAANTTSFANDFVNRPDFTSIYANLSSSQYVDTLIANSGAVFAQGDRDAFVNGLNQRSETQATVLLKVAQYQAFYNSEFNTAFVEMQYFGYLRRDPDAAGFSFWLNKLNSFGGNYVAAEMVKAFILSAEYRTRFGPQ